ncbi:hypothetical protein [Chitinophaga polysaccharea]|uniref:hypothetical protein n=1 Tax=Chitinophaga polysaccharea TaxID=1293035 RepID=UPI00115A366B|nr:hypothetical protein [Chitinophaga polysaccharea]
MIEKLYLMFAISEMDKKISILQQQIKDLKKERLALKIKADIIFSPLAKKLKRSRHSSKRS